MGVPNSLIARSTISIARSTPAQKPRGFASKICIGADLNGLPPGWLLLFSLWLQTLGIPRELRGRSLAAAREQAVEQQQRRADADCGVRDVEGREIMYAPVHLHKIDHIAEPQAIDRVA